MCCSLSFTLTWLKVGGGGGPGGGGGGGIGILANLQKPQQSPQSSALILTELCSGTELQPLVFNA